MGWLIVVAVIVAAFALFGAVKAVESGARNRTRALAQLRSPSRGAE